MIRLLAILCFPSDLPVIENGISVLGKPTMIRLVEDLRIGPESDQGHAIWTGPYVSFAVNAHGHVFIADDRESRVIEFDDSGRFVRQIGGPGQGPGEYQGLRGIRFLEDGRAVVFEDGAGDVLNYYDASFEFVSERRLRAPANLTRHYISPRGKMAFCTYTRNDPGSRKWEKGSFLIDDEMNLLKSIHSVQVMLPNPQRFRQPQFWVEFIADQLKQSARGLTGFAVFDRDENVYTAVGSKYEITIWNASLEKKMVIRRKYKPIPRSEEEIMAIVGPIKDQLNAQLPPNLASIITPQVIERSIKRAKYPAVKNPVFGLIVMEKGGFLVIHNQNRVTGAARGDEFDRNGRYRGFLTHPNLGLPRMQFKNGFAYTIETDQEGDNTFVRYHIVAPI